MTTIRQINVISAHAVEVVALFKSASPNDLLDIADRSTRDVHSNPMRVALASTAFAAAGKTATPDDLARVTGLSEEEIALALRMMESGRYKVEVRIDDTPNQTQGVTNVNRKQAVNKIAAELGAEIARIQKRTRSNQDARMQNLRDRMDAVDRAARVKAIKRAAAEPIVTGVIYKQDRRREQDQRAEAVLDNAASPSVGTLSSRQGPWFRAPKVSTPNEPGLSKGAQVFLKAAQGDPEAQRIVKAAVESVADQVQRAIATHAATTGGRVNKAAGVDTTPNTTFGARGMSAAELAGIVARSQQTVKMFRDNLQPGDNTLDPQFMDNVAAHLKIKLDPVTFRPQVQSRASRPNITSDPDNRPGLSDRTGSPA